MNKRPTSFPESFLWGVATSAYQVEGGNYNNWSVWELENAKTLAKLAEYKLRDLPMWNDIRSEAVRSENYLSGIAIDHYNRFESDFDIVRKMNLNAFRFSIEWSRVEPDEGMWNVTEVEHYKRYIKTLRLRGIEPILTLYHWASPVWFADKGGFEKSRNIEYFVRFAEKILEELGPDLQYIITVNEPDTLAQRGYFTQEHPPQKRSLTKSIWVYRNQLKAHKRIYSLAKRRSRHFQIGFVKNYTNVVRGDERFLTKLAVWLDYAIKDGIILRYIGRRQDFLGVSYYLTDVYKGFQTVHTNPVVSDLGWGLQPEGLEHVLKRLRRYKKPIYVMGTGVADIGDNYRRDWISKTILSIQRARVSGVDVKGYFYGNLFDNFEWAYGRWPRFGLIGIDYENNLRRIPKKSAAYYAMVVKKIRGV
ncbi:glycoside hydrolase family 1 protein [Candidatus Saccharibacteria bacterium]|nr:glycoside hydrolase family 1 protein [Candidatus Saccharibacteria bacterium]NCU40300.1 glycoside hydrolase family 1 protein [Candidatus Saccharibacteria bacterium]